MHEPDVTCLNFSRSKLWSEAQTLKVCNELKNDWFSLSVVYKISNFLSIWLLGCFGCFCEGQIGPANLVQTLPAQVARVGPTSRRATANLDREKLNQVAASNPTEATIGESMVSCCAFADPIFVGRLERYASCAPRRPFQAASQWHKKRYIYCVKCTK